jgi:hypothetical protein
MRDVIVVGGGLAGLSAAWECRDLDVVVLEADDRVGGRIKSERRGDYWLNTGGHVFSGPGSETQRLADEVGVEIRTIKGHLAGLAMNGRLFTSGAVELYPLRVPMSLKDRIQLIVSGIKVRLAVLQYARLAVRRAGETYWQLQDRIYNYRNDRTFADFVGKTSGDAMAMFGATVTRSGGRVDEVAAGTGIGYFKIVWDKSPSLGWRVDLPRDHRCSPGRQGAHRGACDPRGAARRPCRGHLHRRAWPAHRTGSPRRHGPRRRSDARCSRGRRSRPHGRPVPGEVRAICCGRIPDQRG